MGNGTSMVARDVAKDSDKLQSQYATKQAKLLEIAKALRDKGAKALLKVPSIAVIGKQSSGKSSLFEAISGVRVPRDSGTCTRCPMECNLISSSSPWSCTIRLRFLYDRAGMALPKPQVFPFGSSITDPNKVELMLRRAQAAVLAWPDRKVEEFLVMSEEEVRAAIASQQERIGNRGYGGGGQGQGLSFSKNSVCVDVKSEGEANISFADLPGLVSYMPDMPDAVKMVEDMVSEYIKDDCIIIVTIPMADDIENQKALQMARTADPRGERTVVVLTKPDEVHRSNSIGNRLNWLKAINGEVHPLKLGYYCVKLASEAERLASRSEARSNKHRHEAEQNYFSGQHPLIGLNNPGRLGVQSLVADLSMHLTSMLDVALPRLKRVTQNEILKCERKLSSQFDNFDTSEAPTATIVKHVTALARALHDYVDDTDGRQDLIQQNDAVFEAFMHDIQRTAPDFLPYDTDGTGMHSRTGGNVMDVIDVRREMKGQSGRGLPDAVTNKAIKRLIDIMTDSWHGLVQDCLAKTAVQLKMYLRQDIEREFDRVPKLKELVLNLSMAHFDSVLHKARLSVLDTLELERKGTFTRNKVFYNDARECWLRAYGNSDQVNSIASQTAVSEGGDTGGGLEYKEPAELCTDAVEPNDMDELAKPDWNKLADSPPEPEGEASPGDNVNEYVVAQNQLKVAYSENATASKSSLTLISHRGDKSSQDDALSQLATWGYRKLPRQYLKQIFPSTDFTEEIKLMARMRAYFDIMQMRVIDNIPSAIDIYLNQTFVGGIQNALIRGILDHSSTSRDELAGLLSERPGVSRERADVVSALERLKVMQTELQGFSL